jgi:hypothetical protein
MFDAGEDVVRGFAAALAVLVVSGGVARGQTVAEYSQRVDSLGRVWQSEIQAGHARDTVRLRALPSDTVRVGPLIVLSDSAHVALARATAERLEPFLDQRFGTFAHRLAGTPLVVREQLGKPDDDDLVESGVIDSLGRLQALTLDADNSKDLARSWQYKIASVLTAALPTEIRSWLGAGLPPTAPDRSTWHQGRVGLALAGTLASRECAAGAIERCVQALGLTPVADPAFALFDAPGRQRMIAGQRRALRDADSTAFDQCVGANQFAACDAIARSMPRELVPMALPWSVRVNVLEYALVNGGRGAFDRMIVTPGGIRARLEAASGLTTDSLVSRWRVAVMDGPENAPSLDGETAISSLLWAALCGGLALRSSRWR